MRNSILILLLLLISCGTSTNKQSDEPRTKQIMDNYYDPNGELDSIKKVIFNLDMVKNLSYKPTLMSPRMTIDEDDSIWYQIGENSESRFRPEFNFYYYRKTKQLKFLDTGTDSLILIR